MTSLGFQQDNFDAIVNGITQAIVQAHNSLSVGGRIWFQEGTIADANINRSPYSYLFDPEEERAAYADNTDHRTLMLRFQNENGTDLGMIDW